MITTDSLFLPLLAERKLSPSLYCKLSGSMSCPLAALIHPFSDNTTVIGSLEIRSNSSNAFAETPSP